MVEQPVLRELSLGLRSCGLTDQSVAIIAYLAASRTITRLSVDLSENPILQDARGALAFPGRVVEVHQ